VNVDLGERGPRGPVILLSSDRLDFHRLFPSELRYGQSVDVVVAGMRPDEFLQPPVVTERLSHSAWYEAADFDVSEFRIRTRISDVDRPDDGATGPVWLLYDGIVRNIPPLAFDKHAIVAVFAIPIDILESHAIGIGAAWAALAAQTFEPGFQW